MLCTTKSRVSVRVVHNQVLDNAKRYNICAMRTQLNLYTIVQSLYNQVLVNTNSYTIVQCVNHHQILDNLKPHIIVQTLNNQLLDNAKRVTLLCEVHLAKSRITLNATLLWNT